MQAGQILKTKDHGELFSVLSGSILNDAVRLLSSERIGSVVVLGEDDTLVGIFSERDTIRALATRGANCLEEQVNQFMTETVETYSLTDQGDEVLTKMTKGKFRHMPVMEDGAFVGIITIGDIVNITTRYTAP